MAKSGPHQYLQDILTDTAETWQIPAQQWWVKTFAVPQQPTLDLQTPLLTYSIRFQMHSPWYSTWICFPCPRSHPSKYSLAELLQKTQRCLINSKYFIFQFWSWLNLQPTIPKLLYETQYCSSNLCMYLWSRLHWYKATSGICLLS